MSAEPDAHAHFFDMIVRANFARNPEWSERVVGAAVIALVDGLDSPSLQMLAGQSVHDERETERLLIDTCAELGILHPPRDEVWAPREIDGLRWGRFASDSIQFSIVPSESDFGDFELHIIINGIDVTAHPVLAREPRDVLGSGDFAATEGPRQVTISRCAVCGNACDVTWAAISREGDAVHWEWIQRPPGLPDSGVSFPAAAYDAELARIRAAEPC